jgi:hypothetical protein
MVIRALELGLAIGDDLVAVFEFHQILVRAATETDYADQERERQLNLHSVRIYSQDLIEDCRGGRCLSSSGGLDLGMAQSPTSPAQHTPDLRIWGC